MRFLAGYTMRGPMQAILAASVCAVLSLLLPPFSYLGGAVVALVTLRLGPWRGGVVALGAATAVALLSWLLVSNPVPGPAFLLALWLPVWILADDLRRRVTLSRTVLLAGVLGIAFVSVIHGVVEEPTALWTRVFEDLLRQAGEVQGGSADTMKEAMAVMTGALAAGFTLSLVCSLFIARWWQATLYHPGGFQSEFHALRFGRWLGVVTMALAAVAFVGSDGLSALASDLLIVLIVLHLLHGLAVVHSLVKWRGANVGWLIGLYTLLLIALPQSAITLSAVGFADAWLSFRAFFNPRGEEGQ